ncbi:MAG: hypothetical protein HY673_05055 [Chloroflexi bacterium]|nr:hypothetical protein [Chloroflexota bacterium]
MGIDLFQISQSKGIYHTLYLWSMLSPKSPRAEEPAAAAEAAAGPIGQTDREEPRVLSSPSVTRDTEL